MTLSRGARIVAGLALVGLGLVPFGTGRLEAQVALPPVNGLDQVFHPGSLAVGGVAPSREVPICTGQETDPPGCYDGELVRVRSVYIGRDAAEPTIGVDRQGRAYMSAAAYDGQFGLPRTFVMRSTDGGATWSSVGPRLVVGNDTDPPLSLDPYVHVDQTTGRVFTLDLTLACSYLSFSDDQGGSWIRNPAACGQPVNDHQTLVSAKPRGPVPGGLVYENVLYYCFNRVIDASCSRSFDGGITWTPTGAPTYMGYSPGKGSGFFGVEGFCGGLHGHVRADRDGRLFVPRGYCDQPFVSVSEDGGLTWIQYRVSDKISAARAHVAEHFSIAADDAGNVYFLWRDEEARKPWLAVSRDHGKTWGEPMMVAPPGVAEVNFATITAGAEGRIAIQFPGTTVSNRGDGGRPWNSYVMVSTNALDPDPLFVSTTANPIADPIHRGGCHGRCGLMLDYLDITVSPLDGGFWAAIVDTCTALSNCRTTRSASASDGEGVAVRQIGGPLIRIPSAGSG